MAINLSGAMNQLLLASIGKNAKEQTRLTNKQIEEAKNQQNNEKWQQYTRGVNDLIHTASIDAQSKVYQSFGDKIRNNINQKRAAEIARLNNMSGLDENVLKEEIDKINGKYDNLLEWDNWRLKMYATNIAVDSLKARGDTYGFSTINMQRKLNEDAYNKYFEENSIAGRDSNNFISDLDELDELAHNQTLKDMGMSEKEFEDLKKWKEGNK